MSRPNKQTPKTGMNEPCWCGSGAKLKRCHAAPHKTPEREPVKSSGRVNMALFPVLALLGGLGARV